MANKILVVEDEEAIRGFLKNNHDSTDIIICTSLQQTQFASQIAVDMNYVGDFKIIGSYQNNAVLPDVVGVAVFDADIDNLRHNKRNDKLKNRLGELAERSDNDVQLKFFQITSKFKQNNYLL